MLRTLAIALVLAATGCVQQDSTSYPPNPGPGSGSGSGIDYGCMADTDCPTGNVCARTYQCLPTGEVRVVHISWTLQGQPANANS